MFDLLLLKLKAYGYAVVGVLLVAAFAALGAKIGVLTHQRNVALGKVQAQDLVIQGYQAASDAARARVAVAVEKSEITDEKHAALITDLHGSLPKTSDEALLWAVRSGAKINEATR